MIFIFIIKENKTIGMDQNNDKKICRYCEKEEDTVNQPFRGRSCRLCWNKRALERYRQRVIKQKELDGIQSLIKIRDELRKSSDEDLKTSADYISLYLQRTLKIN